MNYLVFFQFFYCNHTIFFMISENACIRYRTWIIFECIFRIRMEDSLWEDPWIIKKRISFLISSLVKYDESINYMWQRLENNMHIINHLSIHFYFFLNFRSLRWNYSISSLASWAETKLFFFLYIISFLNLESECKHGE